ncbi:hypothetical protein DOJK_01069 [Patescibacteria group bacterium]|nr:helix-turn-helix transcriptional regulator [Candidatus Dojkabacteria bacterium]CAG1021548.1 hypothetical protein DOJK_01069 [Patescibacteria group bacterium]
MEQGKRIKYFRKRANVTQLELELRINASFGSISRMETGLTNPTKETLFAIANALNLTGLETAILFGIDITSYNISQSQNLEIKLP